MPQTGAVGVQTTAPSSIKLWLKSEAGALAVDTVAVGFFDQIGCNLPEPQIVCFALGFSQIP
jgi:hypothetical protein